MSEIKTRAICGAPNKTYTLSDSRGGTIPEHCQRVVAREGERCPAHSEVPRD